MSLVISGGETVDTLVSYICGYDTNSPESISEGAQIRLKLETKYFEAEVSVHTVKVALRASNSIKSSSESEVSGKTPLDSGKIQEVDTFIFTMCAAEAAAVKAHGSEVHALCALAEKKDVPVRIVNIIGKEPLPEDSTMHWIGWSLDHGFEFIFIDSSDLMATADEREKEGLPRLMESLHSHQWSSMVPKSSSSSSGSSSSSSGSTSGGGAEQTAGGVLQFYGEGSQGKEGKEGGGSKKSVALGDNPFLAGEEPVDDTKDDGLDSLMSEARRLRELVDTGSLSDAERRDKAAAFAMKFASMVDLVDDEDESDE